MEQEVSYRRLQQSLSGVSTTLGKTGLFHICWGNTGPLRGRDGKLDPSETGRTSVAEYSQAVAEERFCLPNQITFMFSSLYNSCFLIVFILTEEN